MSPALIRYQDGFEHRGAERPAGKRLVTEIPPAKLACTRAVSAGIDLEPLLVKAGVTLFSTIWHV
jgi:hypothetical protein